MASIRLNRSLLLITSAVISIPFSLLASQEFDPDRVLKQEKPSDKTLFLEYLNYQQSLYSSSMDVELGENARIETAFKYLPSDETFFRFRLLVDPRKNVYENQTSKVEVHLNHKYEKWELQADFELDFDDQNRGATALGPDTDSEYSYIAYNFSQGLRLTFYPYNFDGEVGRVFKSDDVTTIYYIEGTPDFISNLPLEDESIRKKTLPGFDLRYSSGSWFAYTGLAAGRYIYPAGDDFKIEENVSAERWKTKTDIGYKGGIGYQEGAVSAVLELVSHNQSKEGGSLLKSAASLQVSHKLGSMFSLYLESSYSEAGNNAYEIDKSTGWFEKTDLFRPVYSDFYGEKVDWLGKKDFAHYIKISYHLGSSSKPYLSYKSLGEYFVYREDESAHRLRTADETRSHGGLDVFGLGMTFLAGNYAITPEVEYKFAKNKVFGNKNDLREDKQIIDLNKEELALTLYATYSL